MKFKTTKKEIMANYDNVIKIGYCDLQYLLMYESPKAYTAGIYGLNADIYDLGGGVAIATGDRPFGNIRPNREIIEKYEEDAKKIYDNYDYEKRRDILKVFQKNFVKEVCG